MTISMALTSDRCARHSPATSDVETSSFFFSLPPSPSGGNKQEETRGDGEKRKKKHPLSLGKKMRVAPDDVDFDTC